MISNTTTTSAIVSTEVNTKVSILLYVIFCPLFVSLDPLYQNPRKGQALSGVLDQSGQTKVGATDGYFLVNHATAASLVGRAHGVLPSIATIHLLRSSRKKTVPSA